MNRKLIIASVFSVIFLVALVSALVTVPTNFKYAILEDDGTVTFTSQPLTGISVIGFTCTSAGCATVSGTSLFAGQPLFTSTDSINLTFPTILQSPFGYGVFSYKEGYILAENTYNWAGDGTGATQTVFLGQKRTCTAFVDIESVETVNDEIVVTATITSPLSHGGPIAFVPESIEDQYQVDAELSFTATSGEEVISEETVEMILPYSSQQSKVFTIPATPGAYDFVVTSSIPDSEEVCLEGIEDSVNESFTVVDPSDTTPPGPVTDLALQEKGQTFITWMWNNPTEEDFSHVIIYLDDLQVGTTDGESFNATGLLPGTEHTITLNTVDFSGNVNPLNVSDTQFTLAEPNESDVTPPGPVTGLHAEDVEETSITWEWNNPGDIDFSHAIIFLDGVNVANSSSESFTADDLDEDTTYTITIHTVDVNGNVNTQDVSDSESTLEDDDDGSGGSGHDSDDDFRFFEQPDEVNNGFVPIAFEDDSPITLNKKAQSKGLNFWLIVLLIILIALILIIILLIAILR